MWVGSCVCAKRKKRMERELRVKGREVGRKDPVPGSLVVILIHI